MWRRQWVLEPNFLCQFSSFYIFWLRGAAVVVWWQAPKLCSRWSSQLGTATWHRRHWHRVHTEPFHRGIQLPQNWRHGHCFSIECGYFLRSNNLFGPKSAKALQLLSLKRNGRLFIVDRSKRKVLKVRLIHKMDSLNTLSHYSMTDNSLKWILFSLQITYIFP